MIALTAVLHRVSLAAVALTPSPDPPPPSPLPGLPASTFQLHRLVHACHNGFKLASNLRDEGLYSLF